MGILVALPKPPNPKVKRIGNIEVRIKLIPYRGSNCFGRKSLMQAHIQISALLPEKLMRNCEQASKIVLSEKKCSISTVAGKREFKGSIRNAFEEARLYLMSHALMAGNYTDALKLAGRRVKRTQAFVDYHERCLQETDDRIVMKRQGKALEKCRYELSKRKKCFFDIQTFCRRFR